MTGYMIGVTIMTFGLLVIVVAWGILGYRSSRRERAYWAEAERLWQEGHSVDEIIWRVDGIRVVRREDE